MKLWNCEVFGLSSSRVGTNTVRCFNHGIHRNAPLCGTEMAEIYGFHAVQPQIAPISKSVYGGWTRGSEVSAGLIRAVFSVTRTQASAYSVVANLAKIAHTRALEVDDGITAEIMRRCSK